MPMAVVLIPFATGIFFANEVAAPFWLLLVAGIASLVGAVALTEWWRRVALTVLIFSIGATLHTLSYRGEIPYNQPLEMVLRIDQSSATREGYTSAKARVVECKNRIVEGQNVVVWGDSLLHFRAGDRLHLTTPIRRFRTERKEYARLMHHRGFTGSVSLNHRATYHYIPAKQLAPHDWAVERLRSTMNEGDARAVVVAMTTGERSEIRNEIRQTYSASGTSHLLAVSGLHIGIAFILINLLLFPLGLVRYGNIIRPVVAVALIWLYVWLCGMSPSAVRSAIMFSLLQISLSSLRDYSGINALASTAFLMLLCDTNLLFDISFQLSFIAVGGILLWAIPLYMRCITHSRIANMIIGALLVGFASTVATMPLVSSTFANVSLVGIFINPLVVLLANIIVLFGIVALAFPPLAVVAEWTASLQNRVVEWATLLPYSHFEFRLSQGWVWAIYALFIIATMVLFSQSKAKRVGKIED